MKSPENKENALDEIVKIIKDFQYKDQLSDKYWREILDEDKVYDLTPSKIVRVRSKYGVLKEIIFWYSSDSKALTASSFDRN